MVEKILARKCRKRTCGSWRYRITVFDMFMIRRYLYYLFVRNQKDIGADKIDDPDKVTIVWDHCMPTAVKNDYDHYEAGLKTGKKSHGIKQSTEKASATTIMHKQSGSQARSQSTDKFPLYNYLWRCLKLLLWVCRYSRMAAALITDRTLVQGSRGYQDRIKRPFKRRCYE